MAGIAAARHPASAKGKITGGKRAARGMHKKDESARSRTPALHWEGRILSLISRRAAPGSAAAVIGRPITR